MCRLKLYVSRVINVTFVIIVCCQIRKLDSAIQMCLYIGSGPVLLDGVRCNGREQDLFSCRHDGVGTTDCIPEESAGVTCGCKYHLYKPTQCMLTCCALLVGTYQKQKSITRTKMVSYITQTRNWCWGGYCTR